ncbi:FkbM family methyltransferase [Pseudocnuella soli]|uniref:FkbM family methyltransferase n=1 Tax=Pseudocnuella soli TaxID=2502779 RepID=UPI00104E8A5C|nr:FkbM family methyltransferase [Pseudocnuella soli]
MTKASRKLKDSIKQIFSRADLLVEKKTPLNSEQKLLDVLQKRFNIDIVIDVGANTGQFALELLSGNFNGSIYSFEPLPKTFEQLAQRASGTTKWKAENKAVGDKDGSIDINIAANTESSSVLPMLDLHAEMAPESAYVGTVTVPIIKLDTYFKDADLMGKNVFLKIDVQGYEESVLDGATRILPFIKLIQLELSFVPLYANSQLYYKMMERLEHADFSFYTFLPAFTNYKTGEIFQVDAVYVRR